MARTANRVGATGLACAWIGVWLAAAGACRAASEEPTLRMDDFATGRPIEIDAAHALHSASLELDVYRRCVEPGLADLRVFNGAGEAVPHAIRHAVPGPAVEARREPLPVFRVDAERGEADASTGYTIDAEISDSGAILHMRGSAPRLPGPAMSGAWIVDASALGNERVVGLELGLGPSAGDFIAYLRVDESDDLAGFRTLTSRAALARFSKGGHEIERLDVKLPRTRARYLRLTLVDGVLPADVESVTARLAADPPPPPRQHALVSGRAVEGERGTFVYDIGPHLPVDRIAVLPAAPNTLLEIRIDTAAQLGGPWTKRYAGLVYRLDDADALRSDPIHWRPVPDRYLRLVVAPKGGGERQAPPDLDVSWHPGQVIFVARGEPPFTLAYGKRGARDTSFRAAELVRLARDETERLDDTTATLGPAFELAGDAAFEEPSRPISWRQVGLWAVLVLAVGIVLALSVRLLRRDGAGTASHPG